MDCFHILFQIHLREKHITSRPVRRLAPFLNLIQVFHMHCSIFGDYTAILYGVCFVTLSGLQWSCTLKTLLRSFEVFEGKNNEEGRREWEFHRDGGRFSSRRPGVHTGEPLPWAIKKVKKKNLLAQPNVHITASVSMKEFFLDYTVLSIRAQV